MLHENRQVIIGKNIFKVSRVLVIILAHVT